MSEKTPSYDAQNFFDIQNESSGIWRSIHEQLGNRYTTSAAPLKTFTREDYERAREAMRNLGPVPDRVEFFEVPNSTGLAVKMNGDFIGFITAAQFEELKAKLKGEGL